MKRKKVWRYYCEYCGKAGCSGGHIAKHERFCTSNPHRECGMCCKAGLDQRHISDLLWLVHSLPKTKDFVGPMEIYVDGKSHIETIPSLTNESVDILFDYVNGCPACTLAAIKQSNRICWDSFHFKSECEEFFGRFGCDHFGGEVYHYDYTHEWIKP